MKNKFAKQQQMTSTELHASDLEKVHTQKLCRAKNGSEIPELSLIWDSGVKVQYKNYKNQLKKLNSSDYLK